MSVLMKHSSSALPGVFRVKLPSRRWILERILDADARYRERRYLQEIDERSLRDVGISRADIAAELRGLR